MEQEKKAPENKEPALQGQKPAAGGEGQAAASGKEADKRQAPLPRNDYLSGDAPPRRPAASVDPKTAALRRRACTERGLLCTLGCLTLGMLFCETIILGGVGISVPVFTLLCYLLIFWYLRREGEKLPRCVLWMMIPNCLLALSFLLHYNPSTMPFAALTMLALWAGQLLVLGRVPLQSLFSLEMVEKSFLWLIGRPVQNLLLPLHTFRGAGKLKSKRLVMILLGILAALPVLAVLLLLFAQADPIFESGLRAIERAVGLQPWKVFYDLFIGLILGLCLAAMLLTLREGEKEPAKPQGQGVLDPVLLSTFLVLLDLVLLSFVGVQLGYFFGGEKRIHLEWITYAEYARRGFFELTAASGIVFTVAVLTLILCRRKEGGISRTVRLLLAVLCLSDGVVLVSAAQRMLLYVGAYGLSIKRLLTLWFMLVVGVSLVWLLARCLWERFPAAKWVCVTLIAGVCLLRGVNAERMIARYNVGRYLGSGLQEEMDYSYFSALSYTAAPELERVLVGGKQENTEDFYFLQDWKETLAASHPVYGFTLDRPRAERILSEFGGLDLWDDDGYYLQDGYDG